jgi:hypothetical protein
MSTNSEVIPDELLLAAIDRAARHSVRDKSRAGAGSIADHLAVSSRSGEWRRVRGRLRALEAAGLLEQTRPLGVAVWGLTAAGRRRLRRALRTGRIADLPESPQHRAWRNARTAAAQKIGPFRRSLRERLSEAGRLLRADPPVDSDAWFELAEQLRRSAWRVGSATHCLYEWPEPDDERADVDNRHESDDDELPAPDEARRRGRRVGRRNIGLWDTSARKAK